MEMERLVGKPIITQEEMRRRIRELGAQIARDYLGKSLLLVGILKGAFAFFADLARAVPIPLKVDFLIVSSSSGTSSSGRVKIFSDLSADIRGEDVLLVEDIVDSGFTVDFLKKRLSKKGPASLKVCALLDKPERRKINVPVDYVGFTVPNGYVVGYGLDYREMFRNLPYIAVLPKVEPAEEEGSPR